MTDETGRHFVDDYRRYVARLEQTFDEQDAMSYAVGGGDFVAAGDKQVELLRRFGLTAGTRLVDVGCGSGRLAAALSREFGSGIGYLGIDVVPRLLDYAARVSDPSYTFQVTTGLGVPVDDGECDMVAFFSVITHLRHEESFRYLRDAARAVGPGGTVVASFLESERHWSIFQRVVDLMDHPEIDEPVVVFVERSMLVTWAAKLGLEIVEIIPADPPGQSVAVLRRRGDRPHP